MDSGAWGLWGCKESDMTEQLTAVPSGENEILHFLWGLLYWVKWDYDFLIIFIYVAIFLPPGISLHFSPLVAKQET